MTPRSHFPRALLLPLLAVALVFSFAGGPAQADNPTDLADVIAQESAEQALETVQDLLEAAPAATNGTPSTTSSEGGQHGVAGEHGIDLTVALRDLAVARDDLPPHLQDDAGRLLARPNPNDPAGGVECSAGSGLPCYGAVPEAPAVCGGGICVHSVASGPHLAAAGVPNLVLGVVQEVAARYAAAGYRAPVGDGATGGNGTNVFDVYLADLGELGLYGYCTTDQRPGGHVTAPAYCVLDNDYSTAQYGPTPGPLPNLKVTAAHEYFHAVQFAYDVNEEGWLMEATAVWAEDEIYDDIDDNRQYLRGGPLAYPAESMDARRGLGPYGAWIFFKFLGERFPDVNGPGGMPVVVRDVWDRAAGEGTARQALEGALAPRGTDLRRQFGWFSAANRRPAAWYSEGAAYAPSPLWRKVKLSGKRRSVSDKVSLRHLSSRTIRLKSKLGGKARVRVKVDVNSRGSGGYALVTVKKKRKAPVTKAIKLNRKGDKTKSYPFGKKVRWIEVTLVNAGQQDKKARISATVR